MATPHYQDPDRHNPTQPSDRLPAEVYSQALDYLVIACVDVALLHQNQVLLAHRNRPPRPSWWILGGRMAAGEAPLAAACRKMMEECGLSITPDRLQWVGVYSTCFAQRQQSPQHHGLHSINLTYCIELDATEKARIQLVSTEYDQGQWVGLAQVNDLLKLNDPMDQALRHVLGDLQRV